MRYIILFIISLMAFGCGSGKPIVIAEKETVTITETVRDTVVMVEPDASMVRALLDCDENRNVVVRELLEWQSGKHARAPTIEVRNNVITAVAQVDSFEIYLSWKEREKVVERLVTEPLYINELSGWQWFQIWLGRIAGLWLLIWFLLKVLSIRNLFNK